MLENYLTIRVAGQHEIIIEKSRFICSIIRATDEQTAQEFITSVKKSHWNASHNCSAYLIGERDQYQKANDDGEPSGTAGVPMLEVLKKKRLKNVAVVVTRYFGGVKLGAGGLVRAYGTAVSETCNVLGIVERSLAMIISCTLDYSAHAKFENTLEKEGYQISNTTFTDKVILDVYVDSADVDLFREWAINLTNGQVQLQENGQEYREKDVI
ncbi:YigZ family protein [Paenilisteria rocourtiae]|uniref:Putative YigZ family protein n=1 Tax=Listeria rocourtiae TaxID=647910 RepID=A0A4R6ZJX5_9LIST|nr:YigZ family protein [Listeria rocourtiae]MBC1433885.1 YigZ family protein [Listeria rocourtiae]MBC1604972.1 YigZ family protein [Listeria rocourtiae]TDR52364.1 putative YigZ family protein [Listeria rocourtiae]